MVDVVVAVDIVVSLKPNLIVVIFAKLNYNYNCNLSWDGYILIWSSHPPNHPPTNPITSGIK